MPDSDQILDKYAQLKLDLKLQEEEKQRKIQEELDAKNPLKQYEKIRRELAESKEKYSKEIKENIEKADEENRIKIEGIEKEQNEKEEKALKSLENLFLKLGGNLEEIEEEKKVLNEDDTGPELQTVEVTEEQKEDDVKEPVGVDEETVGHEEDVEVDEEREEIAEQETTVDAVADAISKQEKDKEKPKDKTPTQKRIEDLEKKVIKLINQMSNAGGGLDPNKISSDLIPTTANFFDLGSADRPWKDLHLSGSTLVIGGTELASSELTVLDNVTAGTVAASKAVIVDSNKDITGFRNVNAAAISIGGTEITATPAELNLLDFSNQTANASKFLRGDGTYQTVSGGGGSKHTIQNAGSDLTERAGLNFDGTKIVATDDSGNDQTDITLGSSVVITTDTQTLTNKTVFGKLSGTSDQGTMKTITVTVASKTSAHPNSGGSSNAYYLDGIEAPFLNLTQGTYRFDQADNSNSTHPLRFYLDDAKGTAFTTGVTTNGTAGSAGAFTQIVVDDTTPFTLSYQCSSHGFMGSYVHVGGTTTILGQTIDSDSNTITNIVNADIKSSAAIALSKLATTTASRALVSSGTGAISASDVTSTELSILDGGTSVGTTAVADGHGLVMNQGGTMRQTNVTTLAAYLDDEITAMPNLVTTAATTVGALDSGSITSGFGTIDTGSSTITTTGNITGGTLTSSGNVVIADGGNIGSASDTDAIAIASNGNVTVSQNLSVTGDLTISGTTTTVNSTVMTVVDPIMTLQTASGGGSLASDTNKDVGLAMQYHTGSAAKTAFLGFDDSAGKLTFIPDATISSEVVTSGTVGTIVANLEGAVTGNADTATALATARAIAVSGDITGTANFDGTAGISISSTIANDAVEQAMIADDAVGADQLASNAVVNASVASGAAIALSKLATTTASRALVSSGTGVIAVSDVTATELGILDGGTSASTVTLADADRVVVNDDGDMKQVALTSFETYFESALDTLSNVTTVGALNAGSITSGFGTIDTGSSTITTTGAITGGSLVISNGGNIGSASDTDAIAIDSSGNVTISQNLTVQGTTTTQDSETLTVSAHLIEVNTGLSGANSNDSGLVIERGSTGDNAIFVWDESADKFIVGTTTATSTSTGNLSITTGTLVANIEGAVTGNASTATALATARAIAVGGDISGTANFDGTVGITITSTIANDAVEQAMIADDAVGADQLASNAVVNASVASDAAIAFSKMENLTASRALASDSNGDVAVTAVTTTELGLLGGGSSIGTTAVSDGHGILMNHGGTMAQTTVQTLAAYLDDEITAMPNLVTTAATTVGALNSGSITSSFGTIDTGSSTITTTGNITGGTLTSTGNIVVSDGGNIGSASDTDAIAIASGGAVTFSQNPVFPTGGVNIASLDIDGAGSSVSTLADADLFIVDDGGGGTNKKVAASVIKTYASSSSGITVQEEGSDLGSANSGTTLNFVGDTVTASGTGSTKTITVADESLINAIIFG